MKKTVTEDNVEKVIDQPKMKIQSEIIKCETLETPNSGHYKMGVNFKDKNELTYEI